MFYLKRHFTFAGGHRLSKHKGLCKNFHGHNYDVWITVRSKELNKNDMVMDFGDLKNIVNPFIDAFDHCLLVNECDEDDLKIFEDKGMRILSFDFDPTAEKMAEELYKHTKKIVTIRYTNIEVDQIEIFENVKSSAIYRED